MGHSLTIATIYLCLLSYLMAVVWWVTGRRGAVYRWLWSAACFFLWTHAFFAFHFYHRWSHAAAVEDTARQTEAIFGLQFGAGIWFSYALLVVWLLDVLMLWTRRGRGEPGSKYLSVAVHLYAFFILFNGTVVFKEGVIRWAGLMGTICVTVLAWRFRRSVKWPADRVGAVHD